MSKVIHNEIKKVVDKFGLDIISDQRILYILSDYGVFDKLSDDHDIVKELQTCEYGKKLLDYKKNHDPEWQSKVDDFISTFIDEHSNYTISDVIYICKALAYGAGLLDEVSICAPNGNSIIDIPTQLKNRQNEYLSLLKTSVAISQAKLFSKPTVFYPDDEQKKLDLLEIKICKLGQELGQELSSWCKDEKQRAIDEYLESIVSKRKITTVTASSLIVIAVIAIARLTSFLGARDAITAFNNEIQIADSLYQSEDYLAALTTYKLAGDDYQESYNARKFQGIAQAGIKKSTVCWVKDCLYNVQALYDAENFYEAQLLMMSKPDIIDCSIDPVLSRNWGGMQTDLKAKCAIAISSEIDGFITAISKAKGKPTKKTLERVDYLLSIEPDNYWLLFIKNKTSK